MKSNWKIPTSFSLLSNKRLISSVFNRDTREKSQKEECKSKIKIKRLMLQSIIKSAGANVMLFVIISLLFNLKRKWSRLLIRMVHPINVLVYLKFDIAWF